MVFKSVRVGSFIVRYEPYKDGKDETYMVVDKDKTPLEYVSGTRTNGYYIHPTTKEIVSKTYILVNNEAKDKIEPTKETDRFKFVEEKEAFNLVNPKQYKVECEKLKAELKANGKALKFAFSFGGKTKPYFAVVRLDTLFNELEMWLSREAKSEQMLEYINAQADNQRLREMTAIISGIDKVKVEDLVEL